MNEPDGFPVAPPPWTLGYHLRFVPAMLKARLGPETASTGFPSHAILLVPILLVIAMVLLLNGVASLGDDGLSVTGVVLTVLGGGGLLALVVLSIADQWGEPRSYERFDPAVFCFVLALGFSAGLFTVRLDRDGMATSVATLILVGSALAGYAAGLLIGYWWQALGVIGRLLAVFAWPMVIGVVVTDLVILSG